MNFHSMNKSEYLSMNYQKIMVKLIFILSNEKLYEK